MTIKDFISKYLYIVLLALAVMLGACSLIITSSPTDTDKLSSHVSAFTSKRLAQLDSFALPLLDNDLDEYPWPSIPSLPDDMVIYKYVADTLQSWYNIFNIYNDNIGTQYEVQRITSSQSRLSSPLASATSVPEFVNLGSKWYILKSLEKDNVRIIEGLVVKDMFRESLSGNKNGVNPYIHVHGNFDITGLNSDEGSVVELDGLPIFRVVALQEDSFSKVSVPMMMRWAASFLLALSMLLYLFHNRSARACACVVAGITAIATVLRIWEANLTDTGRIFSPSLYAHDGVLDSFGSLLIFNMAFILCMYSIFICRQQICDYASKSRARSISFIAADVIYTLFAIFYAGYTFSSLIRNSSIVLELYRIYSVSWYTLVVYMQYAFLAAGIMLMIEVALCLYNALAGTYYTILVRNRILIFSMVSSLLLMVVTIDEGFYKEMNRVAGWSNRLAVNRDIMTEMELRRIEHDIASDNVIASLVQLEGSEKIIQRRLDEMYFGSLGQRYDIRVELSNSFSPRLPARTEMMLSAGLPLAPSSSFVYDFDNAKEVHYLGNFYYEVGQGSGAVMVIDITPKIVNLSGYSGVFSSDINMVQIPPFYSYARYYDSRLISFMGNYAYPMVMESLIYGHYKGKSNFVSDGYRHFVNHISDEEVIVISRRERTVITYLVAYTYLAMLFYLICMIFCTDSRSLRISRSFSAKMRRLVIASLLLTAVAMASISILFVYQRNERNVYNVMSSRISSVQLMLDASCKSYGSSEDLLSNEFALELNNIANTTGADINIYSSSGKLYLSSVSDTRRQSFINARLDPEAYRGIILDHQRYLIKSYEFEKRKYFILYAPVVNADGDVIAIAASPYIERDADFMRDAVFHAATIFSFFMILVLISTLSAASITRSIFKPLIAMSRRMQGKDANSLELLDYDGNDEISSLISAYNTMVVGLQESTAKLAVAERDKAWSEMARQVAHEIKNPLTPIKLEIQRLMRLKQKNDPSWEEKFDSVSNVILEHIDILSQTANEFSTFAKLYSEEYTEFDLDAVLSQQVMLFSDKGVAITYLGCSGAIYNGPKPQLVRVFVNLLTNAVQATASVPDANVVVSLRHSSAAGKWDIVFEDNGPGVPQENLSKLFTPNFTTKSSGTGLGLAICHSIVDKCGGTIAYSKSFSLGGACFTVTI